MTTTQEHRLGSTLRRYWAQYKVVHERRQLLDRPWLEDVLHWTPDRELHGQIATSTATRPASLTSDGWCPGQRPRRQT